MVSVHISFRFTKRSMPEYFDESSLEYEEIHACLRELEEKGFITVVWRDGRPGNIVQKVVLNEGRVLDVYSYLKRTPKSEYAAVQVESLKRLKEECRTPVALAFIDWLLERLLSDSTVKEFFDLEDREGAERLARCVAYVEENDRACYYREFSIRHFSDSKVFEEIKGTVKKVFCRFGDGFEEAESLIIYLSGYHNRTRRRLLKMIYEQLPDARYLHFGDIDAGGFEIYEDLCGKTGIPFKPCHMGVRELEKYGAYTKPLTANDRKRLKRMIGDRADCPYRDVLEYMVEHGVKLEQECIEEIVYTRENGVKMIPIGTLKD